MNIVNLGTAVVERNGNALLVMFPDGEVRNAASPAQAKRMLDKWQKLRTPADGGAQMKREWRGVQP